MLRLAKFTYLSPGSLDEARAMLDRLGEEAMLLSGGTDVLVNIKHRLFTPAYLVGIRELPELQGVSEEQNGWLRLGAGVTLQQLDDHPLVRGRYPALSHAAALISVPQVRTVGTLGGNLVLDTRCNYYNQSYDWRKAIGFCMKKDSPICRVAPGGDRCWAVASADTVPVLIALRAEVTVLGPDGERRIPLQQLYVDDGLRPTTLQPGEIVTEVHTPPVEGYRCVYQKFRIRQSFDFPLVGVAAAVKLRDDDTVEDARVVMTAVASYPERASNAEMALLDKPLEESTVTAAGHAIFRVSKPMDNTAGSIFHRKRMTRILLERALREIRDGADELGMSA